MDGWYYLHKNGELIWKKLRPEEGYFVRKVWRVDTTDRMQAWTIILDALIYGANRDRVRELAAKWKCDGRDLIEYMKRANRPTLWMQKGVKLFLTDIAGVDYDQWMNWLASTPKGESPNFDTMPKATRVTS